MIEYTVNAGIATAVMNRPEKLNAMKRSFWAELETTLDRAEADPEVRALIFAGNGRCFSVGGDIEGFGELTDAGDRRAYTREALGALRAVESFSKPTIAAVHGTALGGGCELTIVCDVVVADATARFGMPETQVGLVPGLGMARGLAQLNLHWMKYLVLTGESLDAEGAKLAGLVNVVTPEGEHRAEAERLAKRIRARAPLALALGKSSLNSQAPEAYAPAVEAIAFLQGTADQREGIAAFEERREARFEGR